VLNLEYAKTVTGWMNPAEMEWLASQAKVRLLIAEIGSWMGRTTCALADNTSGTVYAVDTWKGSEEHQQLLAEKGEDWLYLEFLKNVGARAESGNVVVTRKPSLEAAAEFAARGLKLDMIFIDAAHDYDNVKADILAWRPLLAIGGLFCGHDFDAGRVGVVKAVKELVSEYPARPAGSIWVANV